MGLRSLRSALPRDSHRVAAALGPDFPEVQKEERRSMGRHLSSPSQQASCVDPIQTLEYFRAGPILSWHGQCLWKVPEKKSFRFRIAKNLKADPIFMKAITVAFDYWNKAVGRQVFLSEFEETADFSFDPGVSVISFGSMMNPQAAATSVINPITGEILSTKMQVNASYNLTIDQIPKLLAHELGHALGLAHNFAGSSDELRYDLYRKKLYAFNDTTTVMDYVGELNLDAPLPYDAAAMVYIYQGKKPELNFLHCNDSQVNYRPDCTPYRSKLQPQTVLSYLRLLAQPAIDNWGMWRQYYKAGFWPFNVNSERDF